MSHKKSSVHAHPGFLILAQFVACLAVWRWLLGFAGQSLALGFAGVVLFALGVIFADSRPLGEKP